MVHIVVVHQHQLMRSALGAALASFDDVDVVDTATPQTLGDSLRRDRCDVAVLGVDLARPDGLETVELVGQITREALRPLLVIPSGFTPDHLLALFRVGAAGITSVDATPAQLIAGIHTVLAGDPVVPRECMAILVDAYLQHSTIARRTRWLALLTDRETDVLTLLERGMSNAEIAARLTVSESTVKSHVARISHKLGASNRSHVVAIANGTVRRRRT